MMSPEEIEKQIEKINTMSQFEMCRLWRFAPAGHPYFDHTLPLYDVFKERFDQLGGFTSEISKALS